VLPPLHGLWLINATGIHVYTSVYVLVCLSVCVCVSVCPRSPPIPIALHPSLSRLPRQPLPPLHTRLLPLVLTYVHPHTHTHTHTTGVQRGPGVGGALEPGGHVGRLRLRPQQMQSVPRRRLLRWSAGGWWPACVRSKFSQKFKNMHPVAVFHSILG
jgi:hypothetical protein